MENIVYRSGNATTIIPISTVTAFEAGQKYISVHHDDGEAVIAGTLKRIEKQMPDFVRISRSTLVDGKKVMRLERSQDGVRLDVIANGKRLQVSRRYHSIIRRWFRGKHAATT